MANGQRDYVHKDSNDASQIEQNRKRMKKQAAADQFGYSNASSGRWRKPAGGASAALSSDGANSFSIATHKDVVSVLNPVRPSMMFQTMYSGGGNGATHDSIPTKEMMNNSHFG